jgi:signal transduction histidine kinase
VQEFLQNSMKHAHCKNIVANLKMEDTLLQLFLKDDGKGFDTNHTNTNGIGLANMKKRTEMIGGEFILESELNKGTKLTIEIPIINNK